MSLMPFRAQFLKRVGVFSVSMFLFPSYSSVPKSLTSTLTCPSNLLSSGSLVSLLFLNTWIFSVLIFLMLVAAFDIVDYSFMKSVLPLPSWGFSILGTLCPLLCSHVCGYCFFVHLDVLESLMHLTQVIFVVPDSPWSPYTAGSLTCI